ncbi:MAG: alpha/beta hydrolase, partial [Gammaproteobacteria bacterium]
MAVIQFIKLFVISSSRQLIRAVIYFLTGGLVVLVIFTVLYLNNRPDLKVWHTAILDEEFTVNSNIKNFSEYLALEKRLFKQLEKRVYSKISIKDKTQLNRFNHASIADPQQWPFNWNQSFELSVSKPKIGVLLIHGMSDSPYSLHRIGQQLQSDGAWVTGLRIPGHGTAPAGLVDVSWQDMAAAVKLAVKHLRQQIGDKPLYIIGYSNGGALALNYTLNSLQDDALPKVQGLVLISPEIGITKLAMLAIWQERLGHLLGLEKLQWNSILPEYDSFKYNSFSINAGNQAYELTEVNQQLITKLDKSGALKRIPRILAFQSVVDATVITQDLVDKLFDRLPPSNHELVMFDINRLSNIEPILIHNPTEWINSILLRKKHDYKINLITNKNKNSKQVVARMYQPGKSEIVDCPIKSEWPNNLYSLSHLALAIPRDDPLYGGIKNTKKRVLNLGQITLRGERGVLRIRAADILRLRWNPFYNYLELR